MSERNNPRQRGCLYFLKAVFSFFHADKVVFQTNTVKNMFPWLIRRKGVVIPNPVRVECHASGNSHKIVTMGRLHPQKNHELLINAFAIFAEKHPSHTLHIYGKDYGGVGLVSLIRQKNLNGKVFLEGFLDNVHEAIADAEQFVLSSNHEGTPNALLEAMMMGIPCISTDFVGVREMLGDNDACVLTPLGDEMALAKAMESFADDETLRSKYVRNGCLLAERYSFEKVIPQWKDLLNASL
jgi:glycosyltransferase involved in cell wall biosynthesis